jgi:FkbM family methyltransferase
MVTIGGHTFDETLLTDGVIIDVGCRGFEFANYFVSNPELSQKIFCIDPDEKVFERTGNLFFDANLLHYYCMNVAISDKAGETTYYPNGEATMIRQFDPDPTYPHIDEKYSKTCKVITMEDLYKITGENVDILKLDCEGGEYAILGPTFRPVPKQITVEMHRHCVPILHDKEYPKIVERLSKDYVVANDPAYERRHGCPENWWDVLWIRKDIFNGHR